MHISIAWLIRLALLELHAAYLDQNTVMLGVDIFSTVVYGHCTKLIILWLIDLLIFYMWYTVEVTFYILFIICYQN